MNDLFFVARLVQGLLAVTIVSAIVAAIQFFNGARIMTDLFFVARLVQGLLAVTIVSAIVAAIQFSLVLA